jgi:hypothetical protein
LQIVDVSTLSSADPQKFQAMAGLTLPWDDDVERKS